MSVEPKDPSGVPAANPVDVAPEAPPSQPTHEQQVAYETHRKLLGEKKRIAEENARLKAELEAKLSAEEELKQKELEEQNRWKELHESTTQKLQETQSRLQATNKMIEDAKKLRALTQVAPIKQNFLDSNLFKLDNIILNPETGEIDDLSVQKEAERIRTNYSEILVQKEAPRVSSTAPIPNNIGSITAQDLAAMNPRERAQNLDKVEGMPDWMKKSGARYS